VHSKIEGEGGIVLHRVAWMVARMINLIEIVRSDKLYSIGNVETNLPMVLKVGCTDSKLPDRE